MSVTKGYPFHISGQKVQKKGAQTYNLGRGLGGVPALCYGPRPRRIWMLCHVPQDQVTSAGGSPMAGVALSFQAPSSQCFVSAARSPDRAQGLSVLFAFLLAFGTFLWAEASGPGVFSQIARQFYGQCGSWSFEFFFRQLLSAALPTCWLALSGIIVLMQDACVSTLFQPIASATVVKHSESSNTWQIHGFSFLVGVAVMLVQNLDSLPARFRACRD